MRRAVPNRNTRLFNMSNPSKIATETVCVAEIRLSLFVCQRKPTGMRSSKVVQIADFLEELSTTYQPHGSG